MEPISEERQRRIYEWEHPELKGKDWQVERDPNWGLRTSYPVETPYGDGTQYVHLPRLYVKRDPTLRALVDKGHNIEHGELVPNYQWFFTEAVPQLRVEFAVVEYDSQSPAPWKAIAGEWDTVGSDPIAALAEYVEAK